MYHSKESRKEMDPELWHACAGGMVKMPSINSKVIYFPQGHIEHAQVKIDLKNNYPKIPPLIPCKISGIKYLASDETDEVFAKVRLVPLRPHELLTTEQDNNEFEQQQQQQGSEKAASFAKTLTQSDANNGGGFSVPRYCAETIFPRLDYTAEPPVQTILAKDVHGVTWKFRHIYRGTPRRHLLTTGWSNFVNQKKLVAGDSIVFLRANNGELFVGIRRPKRDILGTCGTHTQLQHGGGGGFSAFVKNDDNNNMVMFPRSVEEDEDEKVRRESVFEATKMAANGKVFEVVYYPRASSPEFFVNTAAVKAAMTVQWCAGMRFKMAFETEDSSRISWFMGTVSCVQVLDPHFWPTSPWRLLQVSWDEPELLQNVKRVNPWSVESVTSMPTMHMSTFSPPRKKPRVLHQIPEIPFGNEPPTPTTTFPSHAYNTSSSLYGLPAGVQGARHAHFRQFLSDHINKVHYSSLGHDLKLFNGGHSAKKPDVAIPSFLTMTTFKDGGPKETVVGAAATAAPAAAAAPKFMLFGKPILTKEQMSESSSSDTTSETNFATTTNSTDCVNSKTVNRSSSFMGSEDVTRSTALSLSTLGSCDGLYKKLAQHAWQEKILEAEQCALLTAQSNIQA